MGEVVRMPVTERGARIAEERRRLGVNQTDFAGIGGVRKGSQRLYEQGKPPTADYLAGIAEYGVDVGYILTGVKSPAAPAPRDMIAAPRAAIIPEAAVLSFPADDACMDTARDVVARPDDCREDQLRDACKYLRDHGDWMDHERAIALVRALDRQATLRKAYAAAEAQQARELREVCIAGLIILVVCAGIAAFDVAWTRHLWAGVR